MTAKAAIVRTEDDGRFGPRKVLVSTIWPVLRKTDRRRWTLAKSKPQLSAAHCAELLSLARADLVAHS